jgi:hypothetical protein
MALERAAPALAHMYSSILVLSYTLPYFVYTWPNNLAHDRQFIALIDRNIAPCKFGQRNVYLSVTGFS